jgi:hypothetical protein
MKRWTLALAVLLGGALSFAYGDYVILLYNVGATKTKTTEPKPGAGGLAGGGITRPGIGQMGGIGGSAPPGVGSGRGPAGAGVGAAGGFPGSGGYGPMQPRGAGAGGGGPMMPGSGSGRMGMGSGLFPGGADMAGKGGSSDSEGSPLYVRAVVEVDCSRKDGKAINAGKPGWVKHKWGYTCIEEADSTFLAAVVHHPSVMKVYEEKKKALAQGGEKPSITAVLELADWTLSHGLIEQYQTTMKLAEDVDPKNPAVVNFKQIDADLKRAINPSDVSGEWKARVLEKYTSAFSEHYTLLHLSGKSTPAEVKSRLAHLENQFKLFYYWFARQGQILPMPQQHLVAVLVPLKEDFELQHKIFESTPLVDDGFFARRENLVVLSQMRIDTPYLALVKRDESLWTEWGLDRDQMLRGKIPTKQKLAKFGENASDKLTEAHTMALLEKALEEDAELAAVSHDGTRQLIAAAGLTTPGVVVPEWIQFGMGSFFETPKGAPWTTIGNAHWDYLPFFLDLDKNKEKKLEKPVDLVKSIVTDHYFRLALDPKKSKPEDEPEMKARALSWALTYYLAHNKLEGLLRYYKELSKLPRDMTFDDEILLASFGRAFELMDATGKKLDDSKLAAFADTWYRQMVRFTAGEASDLLAELRKNREEALQSKSTEKANPLNPPGGAGAAP